MPQLPYSYEYVFSYKERFLKRQHYDRVYEVGDVRVVEQAFVGANTEEEARNRLITQTDGATAVFDIELLEVMAVTDPRSPRMAMLRALGYDKIEPPAVDSN